MASPVFSYRSDPAVPAFSDDKPLIVFDGVCVLCSASARFVLRHDATGRFRLTPAQSRLGQALYRHYGLSPTDLDTFMLVEDGRAWLKSDAALRVCRGLGPPWWLAGWLRIVPRPLRDAAYDLVAKNRYRILRPPAELLRPRPRPGRKVSVMDRLRILIGDGYGSPC